MEIGRYDPQSMPVKRTALGRFKYEAASVTINPDGRIVVYSGDDQDFEYLYRYVSHGNYNPGDRSANAQLLDHGELSVARFHDDGTLQWVPIKWGAGPLVPANGFDGPADVLIDTRLAADLLRATPLDRPEDVEVRPDGSAVHVMLTNNNARQPAAVDSVNPRGPNPYGHILELTPPAGDHAARFACWEVVVLCGDPSNPSDGARWHPTTSSSGWFAAPDNCAFDHMGRMWVTTDQGTKWRTSGTADGLWGLHTRGPRRGAGQMFFRAPVGAELCGPCLTPDDETLLVAVQHPGADAPALLSGLRRGSTSTIPRHGGRISTRPFRRGRLWWRLPDGAAGRSRYSGNELKSPGKWWIRQALGGNQS